MSIPLVHGPSGLHRKLSSALLGLCLAGVVWAQGLEFSWALFKWVEEQYGASARARVEALEQLIDRHLVSDEQAKLRAVNRFFNKVRYSTDAALWGQKDYWATPFEVLGKNSADCEDYALSKYFALITMGVDESKLRITYVKALDLGEAHMVLTYYETPSAEPVVLDNIIDQIKPASERTDLVPVYSFNGAALWLAVNRQEDRNMGAPSQLSRWTTFKQRLNSQMGD